MEGELVKFCNEPTYEKFTEIEQWKKIVLYGYSQYCINKNIGNKTPRLIEEYYKKFFGSFPTPVSSGVGWTFQPSEVAGGAGVTGVTDVTGAQQEPVGWTFQPTDIPVAEQKKSPKFASEKIKKTTEYYITQIPEENKRGLKSLFRGMQFLPMIDIKKRNIKYPILNAYIDKQTPIFSIYYTSKNPTNYNFILKDLNITIDREMDDLTFDMVRKYLIHLFAKIKKLKIKRITIKLSETSSEDDFYLDKYGTVWNSNTIADGKPNCIDCADLYYEQNINPLDEKEMKKGFRKLSLKYHPDKNPSEEEKKLYTDILSCKKLLVDKQCLSKLSNKPPENYIYKDVEISSLRNKEEEKVKENLSEIIEKDKEELDKKGLKRCETCSKVIKKNKMKCSVCGTENL